jgi:hypothetical protein
LPVTSSGASPQPDTVWQSNQHINHLLPGGPMIAAVKWHTSA